MAQFESGFALGDSSGADIFLEGADLQDAVNEARSIFPRHTPVLFDGDLYTAPRLLPFFQRRIKTGKYKGRKVVAYDTVGKMKARFLSANAKLLKGIKGKGGIPPGISKGPNLLPHGLVSDLTRKRTLSTIRPRDRVNFCVGSNEACRSTCLIYSGQNPIADAQVDIKLARSEALLREPVAWLRMFVAAIDWHSTNSIGKGLVPYVRPNVLSDIPWELVFPSLFGMFPDLSFYDYTKVSGRDTSLPNYDLTFSFSGSNDRQVARELKRGMRVAVVFWLQNPCVRMKKPCDSPSELTFLGKKVIDGDHHDFRPLDPQGSIIGLSYKVPTVAGLRMSRPPVEARKFVVPTFRDADTGALIVSGTPSQLGTGQALESHPTELF